MLHTENSFIREHLFDGEFGLEKEALRVTGDAHFAHTKHPFPDDKNIDRDFSENQTEINTSVHDSIDGALEELKFHHNRVCKKLQEMEDKEYLWLFSNPPYISSESDIPIAVFEGEKANKTEYRNYLSKKYGRYKMTFSGIHFNFSFSEELLKKDYELENDKSISFLEYKNRLYLKLAAKMAFYGFIMVAVTAASPIFDGSFIEKYMTGKDMFAGIASLRCSEYGYWNEFTPVFDYSSIEKYTDCISGYIDRKILIAPSELYYPIRLKPGGASDPLSMRDNGAGYIELRMIDLNPLSEYGVEKKDLLFAQALMIWLVASPDQPFDDKDQIQAVVNYKNAAKYNLNNARIITPGGDVLSVDQAALNIIGMMREFYNGIGIDISNILDFEENKFLDAANRYAYQIRELYGTGYVEKALELAKKRQEAKDIKI